MKWIERSTQTLSFIWSTPTSGPLREGKVMSLSAEELGRGGGRPRGRDVICLGLVAGGRTTSCVPVEGALKPCGSRGRVLAWGLGDDGRDGGFRGGGGFLMVGNKKGSLPFSPYNILEKKQAMSLFHSTHL